MDASPLTYRERLDCVSRGTTASVQRALQTMMHGNAESYDKRSMEEGDGGGFMKEILTLEDLSF